MNLDQVVSLAENFADWSHTEKIKFFAWHLHVHKNKATFEAREIQACYDQLHMESSANIHSTMAGLVKKKPPDLLKNSSGYKLEIRVRTALDTKYSDRQASVRIAAVLENLPEQLPNLEERVFLNEAIKCLKSDSPRAAIVMTWCLAYHHLCTYVLNSPQRLEAFNRQWPLVFANHHKKEKVPRQILNIEQISDELMDWQFIEIASSAKLFSRDVHKILKEKLGTRNSAAHPSQIKIDGLQAQEFVDNLVKNVLLKLV
jgi:hypothetical protein